MGTPIEDYIVSGIVEVNDEYIAMEQWVSVDPETISQYTGLKDINDQKIFEGDIIKYTSEDNIHFISVVKYYGDGCYPAFDIDFPSDWEPSGNGFSEACWCNESIEVIGNKWENPELLEEVMKNESTSNNRQRL
ncbi:YopX family protein [Listeria kieliensis]